MQVVAGSINHGRCRTLLRKCGEAESGTVMGPPRAGVLLLRGRRYSQSPSMGGGCSFVWD